MIGVYCFSGTGNTLKCANALEASLKEYGAAASFFMFICFYAGPIVYDGLLPSGPEYFIASMV